MANWLRSTRKGVSYIYEIGCLWLKWLFKSESKAPKDVHERMQCIQRQLDDVKKSIKALQEQASNILVILLATGSDWFTARASSQLQAQETDHKDLKATNKVLEHKLVTLRQQSQVIRMETRDEHAKLQAIHKTNETKDMKETKGKEKVMKKAAKTVPTPAQSKGTEVNPSP